MTQSARTTGAGAQPIFSTMASDPDMKELIEFFVDELQARVDALSNALSSQNKGDLKVLAHQLKGAAGGYGFPQISECAGELEKSIVSGQAAVSALTERVEDLISLCKRAKV